MHIWLIVIAILNFCVAQNDTTDAPTVPKCGVNQTWTIPTTRPKFVIISHYSIIQTFFNNPESAAREAAALLDVEIEWDRHVVSNAEKMKKDILSAIERRVDGLIVTIPNDLVFEAVKEAVNQNMPVIVFNTGLEYARKLGLTRVLQSDKKSSEMLVQELKRRNYSRPLAIRLTSSSSPLDDNTFNARANGLSTYLGHPVDVMSVEEMDNSTETVSNALLEGTYDSVISLGGLAGVRFVAAAATQALSVEPDRRLAVCYYDVASKSNMSEIFDRFNDTFGISQMPYYQAALPVFLMYAWHISGYEPIINKTVSTGPVLVTNSTYSSLVKGDGHSIIPNQEAGSTIGTVIPNIDGDTYQAGIMAGVYDLAGKLNWSISSTEEDGLIGNQSTLKSHLKAHADSGVRGLMLQSSDPSVVKYAVELSDERKIPLSILGTFFENVGINNYTNSTPPIATNVITNLNELAESIANQLILDNAKRPVCFGSHTPWRSSGLCQKLYLQWRRIQGNTTNVPPLSDFSHSINLSTITSMEIDLEAAVDGLKKRGYQPDVYITLSEHVFSALNYRMLRGLLDNGTTVYTVISQFDQIQAFLEGRVDRVWHYNTYSNGFLALLDIMLAETSSHRPWLGTHLSVPRVYEICDPGQYYVELSDSPYCVAEESGITSASIRCVPCPVDTFSSKPNQHECKPCPYGTYSKEGSASCESCDNSYDGGSVHTQCVIYAQDQAAKRRRIFVGVFVPVGVLIVGALLGFCFWRFRKYRKIHLLESPSQTAWLLSYDELMRPSMQHMSSLPSPNSLTSTTKENNSALSPSAVPLLGAKEHSSSTPTSPQILDDFRTPELVTSGAAALSAPLAPKTQRSMSEGNEDEGERQHGNSTEPGTRDYFTLATVHEAPTLLYYPDRHTARLIRAIGFHRNLPVFVKQIGFRRVHLNQTAYHEIALMKMARHSKLVEFIGLCIEPQGTFLVEEYCSKGTLYDVLKNPDLDLTWIFRFSLINDLIEGLEFLHRSKFLFHGCLTSQACVVTGRWELKITDFGLYKVRECQYDPVTIAALSKRYPKETFHDNSMSQSRSLSPTSHACYDSPMHVVPHTENLLWLAPESVIDTDLDVWITYPTKKADIYSLGMVLNEIVTRAKPYQKELMEVGEKNYEAVFDRIKNHDLLPAMLSSDQDMYVGQVNEIIISCLRREPMSRPSIGHVKNRIKIIDPHITGSDNVVDNLALLLEKYANDMENLVRKRTANLQQRTIELEEERARTQNLLKDLKAAKEVAEAAAASKQNFLANMSHEIRTPMNAVIGMSRILMESNLPAELHDCAETIESSGNHLMAIIDDILDYSKIDSGKLGLEHRRMDLIFVFESALKLVAPNYMDKGIVLWYIIDADVSTAVYGDVVRLRQILLNLLSNALKFTSEGCVSVHVSRQGSSPSTPAAMEPEDSDENSGLLSDSRLSQGPRTESLLVAIRDTGIGIRKDKADKLFQTFSQVDASTTRNFGGTGLGLAISRRLSRMMGGDMWFDSESGQGSTFYFTVKLQKQADSPTYASFNCFSDLIRLCRSAVIVADNMYGRRAWSQLFESIPMPQAKVMCFTDAERELKQKADGELSLLVIDEEFEVIDGLGPAPTTSQSVLSILQERMPFLRSIPTICIKDMRNQRRERVSDASDQLTLPQMAKQIPLEQDSPTPCEERRDPFETLDDGRTLYLVKPLKNSKLLAAFFKLLKPSNDEAKEEKSDTVSPMATPEASLNRSMSTRLKRRERSNTIASTLSSNSTASSGRPLNEVAGSVRSLLVDDNPVNRKVVMRMLSRLGVRPEVAQNGKEACDAVRESQKTDDPIDLIFMDIWMPEMNGFEASEYIRSNLSESSVRPYIIAMTACVMPGDREKCLSSGMNGYVSKPVRKDELEASLHTYTQVLVSGASDESPSDEPAAEPATQETQNELPSVKVTSSDSNNNE